MNDNVGKLTLRIVLGVLILLHGIYKLKHGISGISGMVQNAGLPAFVVYGVYIGEVLAPLLVIFGWYARLGAAIIAINMIFALWLAHSAQLFGLGGNGGWSLELQGMFLFTAIGIALIGPGRFSVNGK